jgi:outer membrane protein assembly factor BamE (lipoprotein component of BamABCDE complex)
VRRTLLLVAAVLVTPGCSGALYSRREVTTGQPRAEHRADVAVGSSKAEVLATLGPPGEVLPLAGGDLFVYRLRRSRWRTFDLNTGLVGWPRMSLFADLQGGNRDDALTVRFDTTGRVVDVASSAR